MLVFVYPFRLTIFSGIQWSRHHAAGLSPCKCLSYLGGTECGRHGLYFVTLLWIHPISFWNVKKAGSPMHVTTADNGTVRCCQMGGHSADVAAVHPLRLALGGSQGSSGYIYI
jgi:hypothetical protein